MSYANGRIYVDTSTDPDTGVSIYDVQRALSTSRQDLGELCSHKNINPWARFKPRRINTLQQITYVQNMGQNTTAPFGLSIIGFQSTTQATFVNAVKNYCSTRFRGSQNGTYKDYKQGIKYDAPRGGGSNEPYRLTDFTCMENSRFGYSRNAEPLWAEPGSNTSGMGASIPAGETVDIGSVVEYQDLMTSENQAILSGTQIKTGLAGETNLNYNSISVPLLLKLHGVPNNARRGVIITDGDVYYIAVDRIPWWQWIQESEEGALISNQYVHWYRFDFFTTAQQANIGAIAGWWLIPGLEGEVIFTNGGSSLAFSPLDEPGYVNNGVIQIRFRLISGDLGRFTHVNVRMGEQNGTAFMTGDLSSFWNEGQQYYDMDLPYQSNYNQMTLEILITSKVTDSSSESWRTQWRYTFTVRGN